jgi:hypothetical protein
MNIDFSQINFEIFLFPEMTGVWLAVKIFFILFCAGTVAFMIYVWSTTIYLKRLFLIDLVEFFTFRAWGTRIIDNDWIRIKKLLLTKNARDLRQAVILADELVNDVLLRLAFEGGDLGEKLEKPRAEIFSDLGAMKEADIVYQKLASDPKAAPDYREAKAVILAFEQGLKDVSAFRDK